jgi:integrase
MTSLLDKKAAGRPRNLVPKLYRHPDGGGFVVIQGRHRRLGKYGSAECKAAYDAIVVELLSGNVDIERATPDSIVSQISTRTVADLGAVFLEHCEQYYTKRGKATTHALRVRTAFELVGKAGLGTMAINAFGPVALNKLRTLMAKAVRREHVLDAKGRRTGETRPKLDSAGNPVGLYSRETINKYVWCIQQAFKHAVSKELVAETQYRSLLTIGSLTRGRSPGLALREPKPGEPARDEHVTAAIAHMPPTVATMVQVQRLVGMRPLEVRSMQPKDLHVVSNELWVYRVSQSGSKLAHLEHITREVPLGPKCIALLKPYLKGKAPTDYVFDSNAEKPEWKRAKKSTPYRHDSYATAVERACERAGVPVWTPKQLRHSLATEVANSPLMDIDTARRVLGHSDVATTIKYTVRADDKAREFARRRA